jgi:two-component system, cell cycle sensor histidine kinase and response regulator CckA
MNFIIGPSPLKRIPMGAPLLIFLLGLFSLVFSPAADAAKTVRVGVYDNKPLVFLDDAGKPKGIFIDLLEHVAVKEQWRLNYIPGTWVECLERLETGGIDLLTAIAYSQDRAKKFNFSYETVITNWGQVYVQKNSEITSVLDLASKKIAVKMEDIHYLGLRDLASKFDMQCRFVEADDYDTVFELIEANRVQAGVVNRLFGIQNQSHYLVKETPIMFNPIEVRFAAPKGASTDYLSAIDIHLRRMKVEKDSFYANTLNNWMMAPSEWKLPDSLKYTIVSAGFVLLFFVALSVTLRIRVKQRTRELFSSNVKLKEEGRIREKVEEELRKYEKIVATSTDHMAMIDLSYSYQAVNDAALNAVGGSREEVIGKKPWELWDDIYPENMHKKRLDRAFSGQVVNYRAWMEFPYLGRRYMDVVYTPYRITGNKIAGCVVNSRDVTDRHELELKLENAQKMEFMGTIAGGVAHDLNNILTGIVSYPELLLMQLPKDSPLIKPIETIKKSGEKAAVVVQDLLTLARRGVANKQPVNLNEIINIFLNSPECSKILSFHPNVHIKAALSEEIKLISGSSVHLSKTIMNLVSNAAEAMPNGGEVQITTSNIYVDGSTIGNSGNPDGDYVLLEIADNGMGISEEDLKNIFEPFYTKKVMGRSGTGLGLAVVWGTIMDHHGHIDVKSDRHSGSTFKLYFPISHDEVPSPARESDAQNYKGNGETILVVDDIEEQREIASIILTQLGYSVVTAASGEEAISYLQKHRVDLVTLDMIMPPGMDGLTTYEEILKIRPDQKAIIASGFAETDRVKDALNLGVGQFIKKPYAIKDVGLAVKKELMK